MHSSTFNSNHRIPKKFYKAVWTLAILFFVVAVCSSEVYWRHQGFLPDISDSLNFWSKKRKQVSHNEKKTIVIIGASRAQLGIVPKIIEKELIDYNVVNLAITGITAWTVLRDLAEDPKFQGIILWSVHESHFIVNKKKDKSYVDNYHQYYKRSLWFLDMKLNTLIKAWLQSKLVILSSRLNLESLIKNDLSPRPFYVHMQWDRYRPAYYYSRMSEKGRAKLKNKRLRGVKRKKKRINRMKKRKIKMRQEKRLRKFKETIDVELKEIDKSMKMKGAQLVLIRMPTTGELWKFEEMRFPKKIYWNYLAEHTNVPTIHFKDYDTLNYFSCPDTSHLDATESSIFTKNLIDIIKEKITL